MVVGLAHPPVELGLDLEELVKIFVVAIEQLVDIGVADQDDLDVQGDGLGLQGPGGDHPEHLHGVLDLDLPVFQAALQGLVGKEPAQQVQGLQDEVAAVGPVQGPGPDQGEVGHQGAELGPAFHRPEQVGVGGVVLHDHRGALGLGVVHEDVHLVLGKGRLRHGKGKGALGAGPALQVVDIFQDVFLDVFEIVHHLGQVLVFFPQVLHVMAHHVEGHVLVQLFLLFLVLLFHLADLADGLVHLGVELGGLLAQRLPLLVVQGLEFFFAQGLAFLAGENHQAGGGNVEDKTFFPRLGVQFLEDLVAFLGEAVHQGFPAAGVVFALEDLGDLHLQVGDELLHVGLQEPAFAGGQAQALGLLRVLEIVDVDIIRRRGLGGGQLLHVGHDGFGLPGPGRPGHEDVVFQVLDPQAELQGVDGPVLGHHLFLQGGDVQGGFESQGVGVTDGAQALGLQFPAVW